MRRSPQTLLSGATVCSALALMSATLAVASVTHDQVAPPGITGCDPQPTISSDFPSAALPARMVFRPGLVSIVMELRRPSQATRATTRAFLLGGHRVDAATAGEYTCTSPGPRDRIAIKVKPATVGAAIHRHGSATLRIVLRMVNANGKRTTLRRTVTVTRDSPTRRR
jgi:hypothetical protein